MRAGLPHHSFPYIARRPPRHSTRVIRIFNEWYDCYNVKKKKMKELCNLSDQIVPINFTLYMEYFKVLHSK